jgi:hypothetical protein
MTYELRRKKQYWIEVWEDGNMIGHLSRGGGYRWFIMIDSDTKMLSDSYENLAAARAALETFMKRRRKKQKRRP